MNTCTPAPAASAGKPRLLDEVRAAARAAHHTTRAEEAFVQWIRRFILFHDKRHPAQMAEAEAAQFLTHLAVQEHVSPSQQAQARAALVFLYRHVLQKPLGPLEGVVRASRPARPRSSAASRQATGAAPPSAGASPAVSPTSNLRTGPRTQESRT
jgi:site-specific recombinase XerD